MALDLSLKRKGEKGGAIFIVSPHLNLVENVVAEWKETARDVPLTVG